MEIESYREGIPCNESMVVEDMENTYSLGSELQPKKRSKKKRESPMDSMMVSWKLGRQPIPPDIAAYTESIRKQQLLENSSEEESSTHVYSVNDGYIHNIHHPSMTQQENVNEKTPTTHDNKPKIPKLDFKKTIYGSYNGYNPNNFNTSLNSFNQNSNVNGFSNLNQNFNQPTETQNNRQTSDHIQLEHSSSLNSSSEKLPSVHELLPGWTPSSNNSPTQSPRNFTGSTSTSPRGNMQVQSPIASPRINSSLTSQTMNYSSSSYGSPRIPPPPSPIVTSSTLPLSSPHGYGGFGLSPHSSTAPSQNPLLINNSPNSSPRFAPSIKGKMTTHTGLSPVNSPRLQLSPHYSSESLLSINHSHTNQTGVSLEDLMMMKLGQKQ